MKGRPPNTDTVVPLTGGAELDQDRFFQIGKERADQLKPEGLEENVSRVYDRMAPILASPLKNRLQAHTLEPFIMMCKALARVESYEHQFRQDGEEYEVKGRNGVQIKLRPQVGQYNEAFRQFLSLARDFGLTPASERGLSANGQGELAFGDDDFT